MKHQSSRTAVMANSAKKVFHPEYAGLRALALLLVVVYHIWFNRVSGGVDVFLMLSAFFLTGSIARHLERGKRFDIPGYWRKVSLRIVPATVFVVLVVLLGSAVLLPGNRFEGILAQARATVLFGQNFELAGQKVDYYATSSAMASPLQHFWSLSIQGQFYLAWPLLLVAVYAVGRVISRRWLDPTYDTAADNTAANTPVVHGVRPILGVGLGGVALGSFAFALFSIAQDTQAAYFSTAARIWEFAVGGLLALVLPWLTEHLAHRRGLRVALGWTGAVALFSAGYVLTGANFPGAASLLPLGAAAAIMLSGNTETRFGFDRILRAPVLQFLATYAYALYLWHWPVLIVVQRAGTPMTFFKGLSVLTISLALAIATTRWVIDPLAKERQYRLPRRDRIQTPKTATSPWRPVLVPATAIVVTLGVVVGFTADMNATKAQAAAQTHSDNPGAQALQKGFVFEGAPTALTVPLSSELQEQWAEEKERCPEEVGASHPALVNCFMHGEQDPQKVTKRLVAVGDSHIEQWMTALDPVAKEAGWQVVRLHRPSCRFTVPGARTDVDRDAADQAGCDEFRAAAADFILQHKPDAVYTLGTMTWKPDRQTGEYPEETVVPGYEAAIEPFVLAGIKVIAQRDTPRAHRNLAECVDVYSAGDPRCTINPDEALADTNPLDELATTALGKKLGTFEMTDLLCPSAKNIPGCPPVIGNVLVYLDEHHLTRDYVATTTTQFQERFHSALE